MKKRTILTLATLACLSSAAVAMLLSHASPALGHAEHCHVKGADGKITDLKTAKTRKACEANGGTWRAHHLHCHKADSDGKMVDFPEAKTAKDCKAKGGKWSDHAHEGLGE